jgi:hypothetical protein
MVWRANAATQAVESHYVYSQKNNLHHNQNGSPPKRGGLKRLIYNN